MAKRRARRAGFRSFSPRRVKRSGGSSKGSWMGPLKAAGFGFLYGLVRAPTAQAIQPLTNNIPLGGIADEVGLIGVATAGNAMFGKNQLVRTAANTMGFVEGASIGQAVAMGQVNLQNLGAGQQKSTSMNIIG